MYATGWDSKLALKDLALKFEEVKISAEEFFAGIYKVESNEMLGLIKGGIRGCDNDSVWINSIVIDKKHQSKGYGKEAINLLMEHLKRKNQINQIYLSVIEKNKLGLRFWNGMGFKHIQTMDKYVKLVKL